jgi:hypothetical protein
MYDGKLTSSSTSGGGAAQKRSPTRLAIRFRRKYIRGRLSDLNLLSA